MVIPAAGVGIAARGVTGTRAMILSAAMAAAGLLAWRGGLPGAEAKAALLVVATLSLWATAPIPEAVTALGFLAAAILSKAAPPEVVLSGFASSAFWMIFSGVVIGMAVKATGLSARVAAALARIVGGRQARVLAAVTAFGVLLAFLMPSAMGRVVLLVPILADLVERLGYPPRSRPATGVMLAGILGTSLPSTAILPSNIPNNVLAGIVENLFHGQIAYSDYLVQHFPLFGLAKAALLIAVLVRFHGGVEARAPREPSAAMPLLSAAEGRLLLYLGGAVLLWLTDGIHHVSPAWIGLAAAIVCLLPRVGVLPEKTLQSVNLEPLVYVAGVVGLGAVISHSGLGHRIALWSGTLLPVSGGGMESFLALCGLSTLVGVFTTLPGMPAVLTPLAPEFAEMAGLPVPLVLAAQVAGFSTPLFPYQAPPLVAALQLTGLPRSEMTRVVAVVAAVSAAAFWPLDYLWLVRLSAGHADVQP